MDRQEQIEQQQVLDALAGVKTFIPGMVAHYHVYGRVPRDTVMKYSILSRTKHFVTFEPIYDESFGNRRPLATVPIRARVHMTPFGEICYTQGLSLAADDVRPA